MARHTGRPLCRLGEARACCVLVCCAPCCGPSAGTCPAPAPATLPCPLLPSTNRLPGSRCAVGRGSKRHQRAGDHNECWVVPGPLVLGLFMVHGVPISAGRGIAHVHTGPVRARTSLHRSVLAPWHPGTTYAVFGDVHSWSIIQNVYLQKHRRARCWDATKMPGASLHGLVLAPTRGPSAWA